MEGQPLEFFPTSKDKPKTRLYLAVAVAVVVAVIVAIAAAVAATRGRQGFQSLPPPLQKDLIQSLESRGWVVYMMHGCHFCDKQKATLPYPAYVLVDRNRRLIRSGVKKMPLDISDPRLDQGFPLWYNEKTGETHVGYQDVAQLVEMSR